MPHRVVEGTLNKTRLKIKRKQHFFINPHYEVKFGLKPKRLNKLIANVRNFLTTSSSHILSKA